MANTNGNYRGLRALLLTRVSTPIQAKNYSHSAQERSVRDKLIEPLGLHLDPKHIINDTYTGVEYRYRKALDIILAMAERKEFDILVMDVLDRGLGRKALAREIYRMQLRELGVRVLTTDPDDHADDDSTWGEIIRYLKGKSAEEELNNIRRRTMDGKYERVIEGKLLGAPTALYGYAYPIITVNFREVIDRTRYVLNEVVFYTDQYGIEWTEVKVVRFLFNGFLEGRTIRGLAKELNERGVPTRKNKKWCISTIGNILNNSAYMGKAYVYKERLLEERVPGKQRKMRERRPQDERILMPEGVVPAIIDPETFEKAHQLLPRNKELASRNNPRPYETLLRAGLATCGYCGGNLTVHWTKDRPDRHEKATAYYYCSQARNRVNTDCRYHAIVAHILDDAAWQEALKIIANPHLVDEMVRAKRTKDPTAGRRKQINAKITALQHERDNMEENLARLMKKGTLNPRTEERFTRDLNGIEEEIAGYRSQLATEENLQLKWQKVEEEINNLHLFCAEMKEHLNDPDYTPTYQKKREVLEFFGITAILWGTDHKPRYTIEPRPPRIMSTLSS